MTSSPTAHISSTVNKAGDAMKEIQDQEKWATMAAADRVLFVRMRRIRVGTNMIEGQAGNMVYNRMSREGVWRANGVERKWLLL